MKKYTAILCMMVGVLVQAQTYRYIYEYSIKRLDTETKIPMVLDVNPNNVKFYDYKFIETDSLTQKNKGNNHIFKTNSASKQVLKRDRNSFENTLFVTNSMGDYFSINSKDEIKWKLHNETKNYQENKVQKATATFGGRNWTAWYSEEIPIQEGPYKFRGLPGLIFEIYDDENIFSYKLIKNTNLKETYTASEVWVESYYQVFPLAISQKQWNKIQIDEYQNPFRNLYKVLSEGGQVGINGQNITSTTELDKKTIEEQALIRKYYLPLEKDKAVVFPKK